MGISWLLPAGFVGIGGLVCLTWGSWLFLCFLDSVELAGLQLGPGKMLARQKIMFRKKLDPDD